jgi:hypothetical protein
MVFDKSVMFGAGGAVLGFALALAVGASGRSALEAQLSDRRALHDAVAALGETLGALDGRISALDARVGELAASSVAGVETATASVAERVEALSGRLGELGPEVSDRLRADIEALHERIAALGEAAPAATAAAEGGMPAVNPDGATGEGEAVGIAETATLADGAVRVFLSSTTPEAGTATVAVNGFARRTLALGTPEAIEDCTVTMTGLDAGRATFDAECGGAGGEQVAAAGAVSDGGAAAGTAARPGETITFDEGKLRVFLSTFDPEAGTARVAVNGFEVTALTLGEPVEVEGCEITLMGADGGSAMLDARC